MTSIQQQQEHETDGKEPHTSRKVVIVGASVSEHPLPTLFCRNVRMCVASPPGAKGGPAPDISFFTEVRLEDILRCIHPFVEPAPIVDLRIALFFHLLGCRLRPSSGFTVDDNQLVFGRRRAALDGLCN
jgi:hypothetical protein